LMGRMQGAARSRSGAPLSLAPCASPPSGVFPKHHRPHNRGHYRQGSRDGFGCSVSFVVVSPVHHTPTDDTSFDRFLRASVPPRAVRPTTGVGQGVGSDVIFAEQLACLSRRRAPGQQGRREGPPPKAAVTAVGLGFCHGPIVLKKSRNAFWQSLRKK
jgi:hypothetical protein